MLLDDEGLEAAWARHEGLARAVWAAVDAWGRGADGAATGIACNVADPDHRARSVTTVNLPGADRLRDWCVTQAGVTLGIGLGAADPANALRIAHMGHASAHMLLGVLGVMQAGMTALSIPHGPGALDAAAATIARLARTNG